MEEYKRRLSRNTSLIHNLITMNFLADELVADWIIGEKKLSITKAKTNGQETIYIEIALAEEEGSISQRIATLTLQKWKYFCDNIEDLKSAVKKYITRGREGAYYLHLGKDQFVSVKEGVACVDIRKWYLCSARGKLCPTKTGIALKIDEFQELSDMINEINLEIESIDSIIPCQYTHSNEAENLQCTFCTPSGQF